MALDYWFNGLPLVQDPITTSGDIEHWFNGLPEVSPINTFVNIHTVIKLDVTSFPLVKSIEGGVTRGNINFYNRVPTQ